MPTTDVAANLQVVLERINAAVRQGTPMPKKVQLVAVSKAHSARTIMCALDAGHRRFGENRVQEVAGKWPELRERVPEVSLHLVGNLQTNKAKEAVELFDVIECVDRPKLAVALAREMDRRDKRPECYIEVNMGGEVQKGGIATNALPNFIHYCVEELNLPVTGLMCIPPVDDEPSPYFALLAKLAERHELREVSMGMSRDYEIAVMFGATMVRVGQAIFGPRPQRENAN